MTVMLLSENFPPAVGGTSRWFGELYGRLPRSAVLIVAGSRAGDREFDVTHELRIERLPLSFPDWGLLSLAGWTRYRRAAARIRALLGRETIRRIDCGRLLPEGWLALRCAVPYVCFVHGEELNTASTSRELTWMASRVLRGARFLVANSHNTGRILGERWRVPAARIRVLHPGVDTTRFAPAPRDDEARAALGWSGRSVLLTVGRLQKRKGHDRMIEAVGRLRERFPSLLYSVVGDGEERASLNDLVVREGLTGRVQFLGEIDDARLVQAYQQCDLFVLPHRSVAGDFEGFGMVLLEAQACGKAVITGNSGGSDEAIREGETGRIVDCSRPEVLEESVGELLGNEPRRSRMGAAGRSWVEHQFDFDACAATAARQLDLEFPG